MDFAQEFQKIKTGTQDLLTVDYIAVLIFAELHSCNSGWPQTQNNSPASASQMLKVIGVIRSPLAPLHVHREVRK